MPNWSEIFSACHLRFIPQKNPKLKDKHNIELLKKERLPAKTTIA